MNLMKRMVLGVAMGVLSLLVVTACTLPHSPTTTRPRPEPGDPETLRSFIDGVPTNPPDPQK